jgi:predicted nucleic acid-binding Zn ribbon protein
LAIESGQQLCAVRCRLCAGIEQIQERVTQSPALGKQQFNGIGRPLARCAQCSLAQPFGERLAAGFCGRFDLS